MFVVFILGCGEEPSIQESEKICSSDNDCVMVRSHDSFNQCCWDCGYESVNKKAAEKREKWIENSCNGTFQSCGIMCKVAPIELFKPVCVDKKCDSVFEQIE